LPEHFILKIQNLGMEIPHLGELGAKIKLSASTTLCQKFVAAVGKLQLTAPTF